MSATNQSSRTLLARSAIRFRRASWRTLRASPSRVALPSRSRQRSRCRSARWLSLLRRPRRFASRCVRRDAAYGVRSRASHRSRTRRCATRTRTRWTVRCARATTRRARGELAAREFPPARSARTSSGKRMGGAPTLLAGGRLHALRGAEDAVACSALCECLKRRRRGEQGSTPRASSPACWATRPRALWRAWARASPPSSPATTWCRAIRRVRPRRRAATRAEAPGARACGATAARCRGS